MSNRLAALYRTLQLRPGLVIATVGAITALLVVPMLLMAPEQSASTEPQGDVFTARDRIDDTFTSTAHPTLIIIEPDDGDFLRAEPLGLLLSAEQALRADPELGPTLLPYFESDSGTDVIGVLSLADLVDAELRSTEIDGITAATDEQVKQAGSVVIERFGARSGLLGLSAQSSEGPTGWAVPALAITVVSDDTVLGFGALSVSLGGDTAVEEFDRATQEVFRVDGLSAHGVAIDVNLTSQEQGQVAGPFIGLTVLAALVLVGLTFRSYWVLATVSVAFLGLIIWLKGITHLIGLKDDLILSLIVPVAMISFGVDFAFHALGRYREERAEGRSSGPAFVVGMTAVSGALLLALTSDAVAFLANLTSGIESINQFGVGAAIALASAYLLLGVLTPLVVSQIEGAVPVPLPGQRSTSLRVAASVGAAALTMTSVLFLVFILPWLGVVLAVVTTLVVLVLPLIVQRRRPGPRMGDEALDTQASGLAVQVGRLVAGLTTKRRLVLPLAVVATIAAGMFALRVPAEFDVEDFFASDTDFVVALNQLDTHVGERGGEPALLYIEGNLSDPEALAAVQGRVEEIRALDTDLLARDADGVGVEGGIFEIFDAVWDSEPMATIVDQETGVPLTDTNGDRIPDTSDQVEAVVAVAGARGVPFDATRLLLTPDQVNTLVDLNGSESRTVFRMGVVNSRSQESVAAIKAELDPITAALASDLGGTFVQITGSPFVREASLQATNRALLISLPVALILCLIISAVFLRSLRYGLASIAPIVMVVAWLYGFMYLAGFAINLVTATIGAVSIGIGIDFAIHFIVRYRQELQRLGSRHAAAVVTGEGTGLALVASAASSAVGFAILALAPMPLFAAYGLLTALMITMALVATLAVLPSILVTITCDGPGRPSEDTYPLKAQESATLGR